MLFLASANLSCQSLLYRALHLSVAVDLRGSHWQDHLGSLIPMPWPSVFHWQVFEDSAWEISVSNTYKLSVCFLDLWPSTHVAGKNTHVSDGEEMISSSIQRNMFHFPKIWSWLPNYTLYKEVRISKPLTFNSVSQVSKKSGWSLGQTSWFNNWMGYKIIHIRSF